MLAVLGEVPCWASMPAPADRAKGQGSEAKRIIIRLIMMQYGTSITYQRGIMIVVSNELGR